MPRPIFYRLKGPTPVVDTSGNSGPRNLLRTTVKDAVVSTSFLSIDHSSSDHEEPVLFETMVFGGEFNEECQRYSTFADAVAGHKQLVQRLGGNLSPGIRDLKKTTVERVKIQASSTPIYYQKLLEDNI